MKHFFTLVFTTLLLPLFSQELLFRTVEGEWDVVEIDPNAPFAFAMEELQIQNGEEYFIDFRTSQDEITKDLRIRDYNATITEEELNDIRYVVNNLGEKSRPIILKMKGSIRSAGNRIKHLHPLRFLTCVFTDERMKVSMKNLEGKHFVWPPFYEGISGAFEEESNKNNLTDAQIADFAKKIALDAKWFDSLTSFIKGRRWAELIHLLIEKIPRNTETDRYDM